MTDRATLKLAQVGQVKSIGTAEMANATTAVGDAHSRAYTVLVADAATAGTAVTETVVFTAPRACIIKACTIATPIGVTASDTNYATVNIASRDANGANSVAVATQTTKITGGLNTLTAFKPYALTITAANVAVAAGQVVTVAVPKTGSGVALTAATSYVSVTIDTEEV